MRMSRRAGLISGGDPNSCRVTISRDASISATYPGYYMYVSIDGTDYMSTASTPGPWELTVPKNTAATAHVYADSPQDFAVGANVYVSYLGEEVFHYSTKNDVNSYDFVIDRNLSIVYKMDNQIKEHKSYLYIREA